MTVPISVDGARGRHVTVIVTGSSTAAYLPYWVNWVERERPDHRLRIIVAENGLRFVTAASLTSPVVDDVHLDTWAEADARAVHLDLVQWSDAFVVFPATYDYLSLFVSRSGSRPSLLALQLTASPIVFAPSVPPGALESRAFAELWADAESRDHVTIVPPRVGASKHDPALTAWVSAPLPDVMDAIAWPAAPSADPARKRMATGLLETEITRAGDGWRWRRTPGTLAPRPFSPLTADTAEALGSLREDGIIVAHDGSGLTRDYEVDAPRNIAEMLFAGDDVPPESMTRSGAALAAIHSVGVPGARPTMSRGIERLMAWLRGVEQPPLMRTLRVEIESAAPGLAERIQHHVARASAASSAGVLCHGAPGFGSHVLARDGRRPQLMVGEDVHCGASELDLAWPIGEILECAFTFPQQRDWTELLDGFLAGYGRDIRTPIAVLAQIRILLHMHDFFAYVGWSRDEFARFTSMVTYLDQMEDAQ